MPEKELDSIRRGIELGHDLELVEVPLPDETVLFATPDCLVMTYGGKLETEWEEEEVVWAQLTTHLKPKDLDRLQKLFRGVPDGCGLDYSRTVTCRWEVDLKKIEQDMPEFFEATSIEELLALNSKHDFTLLLCLEYYRGTSFEQRRAEV